MVRLCEIPMQVAIVGIVEKKLQVFSLMQCSWDAKSKSFLLCNVDHSFYGMLSAQFYMRNCECFYPIETEQALKDMIDGAYRYQLVEYTYDGIFHMEYDDSQLLTDGESFCKEQKFYCLKED